MRRTDLALGSGDHPLDMEIADLVDGLLDPESSGVMEAHLAQCLLCRIKRQRLVGQPRVALSSLSDVTVPEFNLIETLDRQGDSAKAGELWVTKEPASIVVLVRSVGEVGAVVIPIIIDVELADDECQIVPAKLSPLGVSISIYSRLRVNVPASSLCKKIVPCRDIDLLNLSDMEGVYAGHPIERPDDPRLEIRQWLADQLIQLTDHQVKSVHPPDSESNAELRRLQEALDGLRTSAFVEPFINLRTVDASERGWAGIARVEELGVVVLVIDTLSGLVDQSDFVAAHTLLTRCNASALAVVAFGISDLCEVFDAPGLFGAMQVLDGGRRRQPLISDMPLSDAIIKYLDSKLRVPLGTSSTVGRGKHLDVEEVLARQVVAAVESTVNIGKRAKIKAKKVGYHSVGENAEAIKHALNDVLLGGFYPDKIADIAGGVDQ